MMEEGAAKSSIVEENVGCVLDFMPFGFAYTVHFLISGAAASTLIPSDVHLEINLVEVKADPVSVWMNQTEWVRPRSSVSVSHCLRAMMMEAVLSNGRQIQPVSLPDVETMYR